MVGVGVRVRVGVSVGVLVGFGVSVRVGVTVGVQVGVIVLVGMTGGLQAPATQESPLQGGTLPIQLFAPAQEQSTVGVGVRVGGIGVFVGAITVKLPTTVEVPQQFPAGEESNLQVVV